MGSAYRRAEFTTEYYVVVHKLRHASTEEEGLRYFDDVWRREGG